MAFVQRAQDCLDVPIWAPAFSHADKDPVPDAIRIEPTHRVLLFEGLYCCLDEEPWVQAARCWDRAWFLHVSTQVARSRLIQRHLESGIVHGSLTLSADTNDIPNGDYILAHIHEPIYHITEVPSMLSGHEQLPGRP